MIVWQVMHCDFVKTQEKYNTDSASFSPSSPREKWLRRRTHVKLRVSTSHTPTHNFIKQEVWKEHFLFKKPLHHSDLSHRQSLAGGFGIFILESFWLVEKVCAMNDKSS